MWKHERIPLAPLPSSLRVRSISIAGRTVLISERRRRRQQGRIRHCRFPVVVWRRCSSLIRRRGFARRRGVDGRFSCQAGRRFLVRGGWPWWWQVFGLSMRWRRTSGRRISFIRSLSFRPSGCIHERVVPRRQAKWTHPVVTNGERVRKLLLGLLTRPRRVRVEVL